VDYDYSWISAGPCRFSSHPDRGNDATLRPFHGDDYSSTAGYGTWHFTWLSGWGTTYERGVIDRNFLYDDGAVKLMTELQSVDEPRLVTVPVTANNPNITATAMSLPAN